MIKRPTNKELLDTINLIRDTEECDPPAAERTRAYLIELMLLRQIFAEMTAMTGATEEEAHDHIGNLLEELTSKLPFSEREITYEELFGE
jgi:hypothetical protein